MTEVKATSNVGKNKRTAFKDLLNILKTTKKNIFTKILHDGSVYIYDSKNLLASFKYYGGTNIIDLKINSKRYIGKTFYRKLKLSDVCMTGGTELCSLLRTIFPDANKCNPYMNHAYEFSILEAALLDPDTRIELSRHCDKGFDVALMNYENNITSSFRYYNRGMIRYVYLRYNLKVGVKINTIHIPKYRIHLFTDLLTRDLTPFD